jgi:HEAT repeat protein
MGLAHKPGLPAVEALIRALADEERRVRYRAIESLATVREPAAVDTLMRLVREQVEIVENRRFRLLEALGNIGDRRAVGLFIECLDGDTNSRLAASAALGRFEDSSLVPVLLRAFHEAVCCDDWLVNARLAGIMGRQRVRAAVPDLLRMLGGPITWGKPAAVRALGEIGAAEAVEPLSRLLETPWVELQREVVVALGRIGDPRAADALLRVLETGEPSLRLPVIRTLGGIRSPVAVDALAQVLDDPRGRHRREAAGALARIGAPALPALEPRLYGTDAAARRLAASCLGRVEGAGAVLERALRDTDSVVRARAASGLGRVGTPSCRVALLDALADSHPAVRAAAAHALGVLGAGGGEERLRLLLEDPEANVARAAAAALSRLAN